MGLSEKEFVSWLEEEDEIYPPPPPYAPRVKDQFYAYGDLLNFLRCSLSLLPDHVIVHVVNFLDPASRVLLGAVNHRFNQIVKSYLASGYPGIPFCPHTRLLIMAKLEQDAEQRLAKRPFGRLRLRYKQLHGTFIASTRKTKTSGFLAMEP